MGREDRGGIEGGESGDRGGWKKCQKNIEMKKKERKEFGRV